MVSCILELDVYIYIYIYIWYCFTCSFLCTCIHFAVARNKLSMSTAARLQAQYHGCGKKKQGIVVKPVSKFPLCLFAPYQSGQHFLRYFQIWPWKVRGQGHGQVPSSMSHVHFVSNQCTSFRFRSIGPTDPEIWPIEYLILTKDTRNFEKQKSNGTSSKWNHVISMTKGYSCQVLEILEESSSHFFAQTGATVALS